MGRVITVILHKDGRHHLTLTNCTRSDAERWAAEGFHVFLIAARSSELWAINHVNSGKVFSNSSDPLRPQDIVDEMTPTFFPQLPFKG
jgi:hypothetical protein